MTPSSSAPGTLPPLGTRLTIRILRDAADAEPLQRIFVAAGDHFLSITGRPAPDADAAAREIRASLTSPGRAVALLTLRESGEDVGALGWWAGHPEPDVALLGMLLIVPALRGAGLAHEALATLEARLAGEGITRLRAAAGAGDARAHAILRALGFAPLDELRHIGLDRGRIQVALFEKRIRPG